MRYTPILLFSLLGLAPIFSQTADQSKGCSPLTVQFTAPAGHPNGFWDFKDGGSSNLLNPSNTFTSPGTYAVEFHDTPGGPVVGTVTITVFPKPVVIITAAPEQGCRPLPVQFTDGSTKTGDIQITGHTWIFGDGSNPATTTNPNHTYLAAGNFSVSLKLTTNYPTCDVTQVFTDKIKVSQQPQVGFTTAPAPPAACTPPLNVSFTNTTPNTSGLTFKWDFGNGQMSSQYNPPAQNYTQIGNFPVILTVTDALGCSGSTGIAVNVGNPPVDFILNDTVCFGAPVQILNQSGSGSYAWTFGPNATPQTSGLANPTVTFNKAGNQQVTLTVTASGGCSSTKTVTVFVDKPDASFQALPTYSCNRPVPFGFNALSPAATQWAWKFSDGSTSTIKNPTYIWQNPDKTGYTSQGLWRDSVWLTVTNASGCTAEKLQIDTIWLPNARFAPDVYHGCAPLKVTFADSSHSHETILSWEWDFGDGSPKVLNNTGADVMHNYPNPGEYDVHLIITNSRGCVDTSFAWRIEVGTKISGTFTVDKQEVCPGEKVQFINTTNDPRIDAWHFDSDDHRLWHCYGDKNATWQYVTEAGPMPVTLWTEYNGCYQSVTQNDLVKVKGPIAHIHFKTTCANSLSFDFTDKSSGASDVKWYYGHNDSTVMHSFSNLYPDSVQVDTVILVATNATSGCPASADTALVYPTNVKAKFDLPDIICGGQPYQLIGSQSNDVNHSCYKGLTWFFDFQRPIRTSADTTEFTFGVSGPHLVWLEAEDINGCRDTIRDSINVFLRNPSFTVNDDTICLPATLQFTDQSTADATIVKYEWDFGDGMKSTDKSPNHTFSTPPINGGNQYVVTLKITDEHDCPDVFTKIITLYTPVSPINSFPFPPNICAGATVIFTAKDFLDAGSHLSWSWDFGDGSATSPGKTVQHTYPQAGIFTVKNNFVEAGSGCKGTEKIEVQVQAYPTAQFTSSADGQSILCNPAQITFNNTSQSQTPTNATWDFGSGITATGQTASFSFLKGTHTVKLTATTSFGCESTTERSFTVVGPEGKFEMDKNLICVGGTIQFKLKDTADISSWSWSFDGVTIDGTNPVSHTFNLLPPSSATVAKVVFKGQDDACSLTYELPVNFSKVKADFTVPASGCFGLPFAFSDASTDADAWQWNFGDGQIASTQNPSHNFQDEGDFTVKLLVIDQPLGCRDSISKTITVAGLPNLQVVGDMICPGDTATVQVQNPLPGAMYAWSGTSPILGAAIGSEIKTKPTKTSTYSVSVTDAAGCKGEATAEVLVPTLFQGGRNLDTIIVKGNEVTLPLLNDPNFDYKWSPSVPPATPPSEWKVKPDSTQTYTVTITDAPLGCHSTVFTFKITVISETVHVPNAFTPGNDMLNEIFKIIPEGEQGLVEVQYLRIYDRWGEKVFEGSGTDKTVGWDGRIKGELAPSDVYVWIAGLKFLTGNSRQMKGDVTLLR